MCPLPHPICQQKNHADHEGVSKNRGTLKSSILIGILQISIINHPFWGTTIFGNTHEDILGFETFTRTKYTKPIVESPLESLIPRSFGVGKVALKKGYIMIYNVCIDIITYIKYISYIFTYIMYIYIYIIYILHICETPLSMQYEIKVLFRIY